ncbi:pilus assembly protein PilY [Methylophaga nitratireducenticrescens]|nr:pilus assembly protein PilY [Methylophaga nitratireducenticrescens]
MFMQLFFALMLFGSTSVYSTPLSLSNVPLYLGGAVAPNVMFLLDDSGSMQFETMPDAITNLFSQSCCTNYQMWVYPRVSGLHGAGDYSNATRVPSFTADSIMGLVYRSALVNTLYYNPAITYKPWVDDEGNDMPDADPAEAPNRPLFTEFGTRNLIVDNTQSARWIDDRANSHDYGTRIFYPAVYSTYIGPEITDINAEIINAAGPLWDVDNYTRTEIRSSTPSYSGEGRENRTDCLPLGAGICSYDDEIRNFANWYTYHRNRIFASRAGIGRAFSSQPDSLRVGFGAINKGNTTIDGRTTGAVMSGVRAFSDSKENFYSSLYELDIPAQGTPLRRALQGAGEYFSRSTPDPQGPWNTTPGVAGGEDLICRQSYTILMSDGSASGGSGNAATDERNDNNDGSADNSSTNTNPEIGEPDFIYSPVNPFQDNISNTLADVAMYYWKRDLRTDLENRVPTNDTDSAFWQHMTTFTVGLGVSGSIDPDEAFAAIGAGTSIDWGDPDYDTSNCTGATCIARQDDFLHAAVNSRGGFFSAADPDTFASELENVLFAIQDREESSASSVALNSGSISSNSRVFQARFDSRDWSGQLLSFAINTTPGENLGNLIIPEEWDARNLIPTASNRKIITYDGTNGKPFRLADISVEQQALLGDDEDTLNYLRGDQSNEVSNGGAFRNRSFLLGDIINSNPALVAAPVQRYPDNWGSGAAENLKPYSTFREDNKSRLPVVYVGANDGMLHAFNANTGAEIFSYVPSVIYDRLPLLTDPDYTHRYYVDGSPTVVDAFVDGDWKTILVSGLGAGGQGIFALDVTDPDVSSTDETALASKKVLWEYTDKTDADSVDMGYTFGQPSIVRLQNGQWAALFSGGYNNTVDNHGDGSTNDSTTGNAVLYLVDLFDGTIIAKFNTKQGSEDDPTDNDRPNGFASPAAIDVNGDSIVDFIYAGDLFGNMWKIDVSDPVVANWGFAFGTEADPKPLFKACFGNDCEGLDENKVQPITTRPQIVRHPTSRGFLVMFGTGKYFEVGDNSATGQITQSFYSIWDKAEETLTPIVRNNLLEQTIDSEVRVSGSDYRVTSDTAIDWASKKGWFIDLISPGAASNLGERQVSNAIIRNGKVIFTTLLPSDDPCLDGGTSWLMELDFVSGARLQYSPFDTNDDSNFDSADYICIANCDNAEDSENPPEWAPVSGKKSEVGIIPTPSIASEAGGQREYKYTSGSSGQIEVTVENPGPGFEGRQSWRQLDFQFR